MRLRIVTPLAVVVDEDGVSSVRAMHATGAIGVQERHADFLTSLVSSVVSWDGADGRQRYCAVQRGVLCVDAGRDVTVVTREAVLGHDPQMLERTVLARLPAGSETPPPVRHERTRLHLNPSCQRAGRPRPRTRRPA